MGKRMNRFIEASPEVYIGVVQDRGAKGQTEFIKKQTGDPSAWQEQLTVLAQHVDALQHELDSLKQRYDTLQAEMGKEREYLYQVVLSLKKEWELQRTMFEGK